MAGIRRTALGRIAAAAALLTAATGGPLRLEPGREPGGLVITNATAAPVSIARAVRVEQRRGTVWRQVPTEMNAVASCADGASTPVRLAPGARLTVVPWRGASCAGQCATSCRANVDYAPGDFRFGVTVLPSGGVHYGPVFRLPRVR